MTSYIIPLPFVLLSLESVQRKRKKLQKLEYLENKKCFFDVLYTSFIGIEGLLFGEKIKI